MHDTICHNTDTLTTPFFEYISKIRTPNNHIIVFSNSSVDDEIFT